MTPQRASGVRHRFPGDDIGFLRWREDNLGGYILNTSRYLGPSYLMLHRSGCPHLKNPNGQQWTKDYIKFCAHDRARLEAWASTIGDVRHCRTCIR